MHRCLELAKQGAGYVAPNPMVGAVLVHEEKIIGEGWHKNFGGPHAEVNCLYSVCEKDRDKVSSSVLYVSLEPCAHFGKTPPCADLIIKNKIPKVVIGSRDPFPQVNGSGVEKLKAAGVSLELGILENECQQLNKRFFSFYTQQRPYVVLKWAETADGKISSGSSERLHISNELSNRLVHKWRSEEASILVGTNTALLDDPELTTRNWAGPSPIRLVLDMDLKLPSSLKIFNNKQRTVIFNKARHGVDGGIQYYKLAEDTSLARHIIEALYHMKIHSVLVEGGAKLLQSFIDEAMWDEIRVIKNTGLVVSNGLAAPVFIKQNLKEEFDLAGDRIQVYYKN